MTVIEIKSLENLNSYSFIGKSLINNLAIGTFALIHKGHIELINKMGDNIDSNALISLRHNNREYCSSVESIKMAIENKISLLIIISMTAEDYKLNKFLFIQKLIKAFPNLSSIHCGEDWEFGYNREGKPTDFKKFNIKPMITSFIKHDNEKISTKKLVKQIKKEKFFNEAVKQILSKPSTRGIVIEGKKLGRKLGFPTANIKSSKANDFKPSKGIYFTITRINDDGPLHPSITNIGESPTIETDNNREIKSETHLLNFNRNIYGKEIEVFFLNLHNKERKHNSLKELKQFINEMVEDRRYWIDQHFVSLWLEKLAIKEIEILTIINKLESFKKTPNNSTSFLKPLMFSRPENTKCIIIGQNPYPTKDFANGLAFDVKKERGTLPPSLKNIIKKLKLEYNLMNKCYEYNGLEEWAKQGVILLNTEPYIYELDCEKSERKWKTFNDFYQSRILEKILILFPDVPIIAWGKQSQNFIEKKDIECTNLITGVHPSPLSAHKGFFSKSYFKEVNNILESQNKTQIDWLKAIKESK